MQLDEILTSINAPSCHLSAHKSLFCSALHNSAPGLLPADLPRPAAIAHPWSMGGNCPYFFIDVCPRAVEQAHAGYPHFPHRGDQSLSVERCGCAWASSAVCSQHTCRDRQPSKGALLSSRPQTGARAPSCMFRQASQSASCLTTGLATGAQRAGAHRRPSPFC